MTNALLVMLPVLLFIAALLMVEVGYQYRLRSQPPGGDGEIFSGSAVTTAVLSLMGLVLAFSYSNAAERLEASRLTILNEVNAIETAWMRIDVAAQEDQSRLRELVRTYL